MIYKIEFHAMGSRMLAALDGSAAQTQVLEQVPGWFAGWEKILSRFLPDSELNRLNRSDGKPFKANPTLWQVLKLSLKIARQSDRLITPEVLDNLQAAGYDRSFGSIESGDGYLDFFPQMINSRLDEICMDPVLRTIQLPRGMHLDVGGVAKGWAAYRTMLRLKKHGPALVDAGGDIAVSGPLANGDPWPVGIRDPFEPTKDMLTLNLANRSVATSGKDYHKWLTGNILQHHIIDPRSGAPAQTDVLAATVIAPTVMQAEMLAKMMVILGSNAANAWLQSNQQFSAALVLENGNCHTSSRFSQFQGK